MDFFFNQFCKTFFPKNQNFVHNIIVSHQRRQREELQNNKLNEIKISQLNFLFFVPVYLSMVNLGFSFFKLYVFKVSILRNANVFMYSNFVQKRKSSFVVHFSFFFLQNQNKFRIFIICTKLEKIKWLDWL